MQLQKCEVGRMISLAKRERIYWSFIKYLKNVIHCTFIFNVPLYKPEYVNVLLGWVSIPLSNDIIKKSIEEVFGNVNKITEKIRKEVYNLVLDLFQ